MSHYWCPHHRTVIVGRDEWEECELPHERLRRVWAWSPSLYWSGWKTLLPAWRSSDEYGRRTLVLGWSFTGCVIIAMYPCGCHWCDWSRQERYFDGLEE